MPKPRWKADGATVFEHGRIAFTCHTPKGARRIVALLNDAESAKAGLAVYKALFSQSELDRRVKSFNSFAPGKD